METIENIHNLLGLKLPLQDAGKFIKIFPETSEQFRIIQNTPSENKIKFFSINPRNERPLKIVIKGVPSDIPMEEVRDELINLGFDMQIVSQLKRFKDKMKLPIFLCNLHHSEKTRTIYYISKFLGFIVKN